MASKMTIMAATKAIRDLARQDRCDDVDDSYARTHDAKDTIERWRSAAAEAGDTECVQAIDRLGVSRAAEVYAAARPEIA